MRTAVQAMVSAKHAPAPSANHAPRTSLGSASSPIAASAATSTHAGPRKRIGGTLRRNGKLLTLAVASPAKPSSHSTPSKPAAHQRNQPAPAHSPSTASSSVSAPG